MSHNQKKAFWIVFISFCFAGTTSLYRQSAFDNIGLGGSMIIVGLYLIVAIFIRKYIKSNPKDIEKWFVK